MKKYLMLGVAALALASCNKNDFTPMTQGEVDKAKYDAAFEKYVGGKVAANQTWGFGSTASRAASLTRTHNADAHLWGVDWYVPDTLTAAQKNKVRRYFQENELTTGESIDFTNFFVQDVYKGATNPGDNSTEVYTYANGSALAGSANMDKLTAGSENDHINNYNNAKCTVNNNVWDGKTYVDGYTPSGNMTEDKNHYKAHSDAIMLMVNSKTDCFGYYSSAGSCQHNDKFIIISGETIDTWAAKNNVPGESLAGRYFVGFDYEALVNLDDLFEKDDNGNVRTDNNGNNYLKNNTNMYAGRQVSANTPGAYPVWQRDFWVIPGCADGYYTDWIVCITEGVMKYDLRIIAEDLSATEASDFDFNDIVLDVKYGNPVQLRLMAAGGTMELRINEDDNLEVHKLFNVNVKDMVNTGAGPTKKPVEFKIEGKAIYSAYEANGLKIEVMKNGVWQELTAIKGEPACKLAVDGNFQWLGERQSIKDEYEKFVPWATDNDFNSLWWY